MVNKLNFILKYKIYIPQNFQLTCNNKTLNFLNLKTNQLSIFTLNDNIEILENNLTFLYITLNQKINKLTNKKAKTLFNTQIALLNNFLKGLQQNYKLKIHFIGIGFKIELKDSLLFFKISQSHTFPVDIPKNINVILLNSNCIICYSSNWSLLTNFAAAIKRIKPIEPYKGKGISLENEKFILRKEGKTNKK